MHSRFSNIEQAIEELRHQDEVIKYDLERIQRELVDKTPEHFSKKDIMRAFMGSFFLAFGVLFSSNLLSVARVLPPHHLYIILGFTVLLLTEEIYFVGYARVINKHERKFGQFWIKRLLAFYLVALVVSFMITYVFGLIYIIPNSTVLLRFTVLISCPAAIGASIGDLIKKY
jgi:uncharacterized membrane protein